MQVIYFSVNHSNKGIISIVFTSTSPLLVNLMLGITDKGSKLNPIYANVHPDLFH